MKKFKFIISSILIVSSLGATAALAAHSKNDAPVLASIESSHFGSSFSILAPYSSSKERMGDAAIQSSVTVNQEETLVQVSLPEDNESTFILPLAFSGNETLQLIASADGSTNGSCLIIDQNDFVTGYIIVKTDNATGEVIDGNKISITSNAPNVLVSARADSLSTYFSDWQWGLTDDGYTKLALTHKNYLFSVTVGDPPNWQEQERQAKRAGSWSLIQSAFQYKFPNNLDGMKNQYFCHYDTVGRAKNPWNLEVERPDPGYWGTVGALCNPK